MTYTERLIITNLLPLQFRREITDLTLMYKSKTGLIPMDVNNYLRLYEPGLRSRHYIKNNLYFLIKKKLQHNTLETRSLSDQQVCGTVYQQI